MPQLVKGGKLTYGWSRLGPDGRLVIPPEALREYRFQDARTLILLPGSRTSGGFALASPTRLRASRLVGLTGAAPSPAERLAPGRAGSGRKARLGASVALQNGIIEIPAATRGTCGIRPGDLLLAVRGSGLALAFAQRGPIVAEAGRHPELPVFDVPASGPTPP